jgi:hypothetical protein
MLCFVAIDVSKTHRSLTGADAQEGDAENMDEEEASEPEEVIHETMFTFEAFEMVSLICIPPLSIVH